MFGTTLSGDFLAARTAATPDRTALLDLESGEAWTYRELDDAAEAAAGTLSAALDGERMPSGGQPRLGILCSTRPAYVVLLYAAWRLGWTVVPLHARLAAGELSTRIRRVDPEVVVCEQETEALLFDALADADAPDSILSVDEPQREEIDGVVPEGQAGGQQIAAASVGTPVGPEETALLVFTSGTTGEPKGVRLTPRNLGASAIASAFRLGVAPADRWLCCLPMYHMGGLAPAIRTVLYGTELAIQPTFEASETAETLAERGITGVSLVPTQLKRLLDTTNGLPAPDLRTVLLGGAPASESLLSRADEAAVPVYPTYGMTETASQVATARPREHREHPGTVGQPLLGTRVTVLSRESESGEGVPVEPGERGEIVVAGPTVTPGYLDEERTAEAFGPHGLHTGDVGRRDDDGRLWIAGRVDDMVLSGGELVAPAAVAEQLRAVEGVADVAVLGIPDEEWGEAVAALVVPADGSGTEQLRDEITSHCRTELADYKSPKVVEFTDDLPRTQSGTVDREATEELLTGRRSRRGTD